MCGCRVNLKIYFCSWGIASFSCRCGHLCWGCVDFGFFVYGISVLLVGTIFLSLFFLGIDIVTVAVGSSWLGVLLVDGY